MHKTHTQQLADYIKKNLKKGYTIDSLRFSLINQGYTKISVENAIELANKQLATEIPLIKERPEIIYKIVEEDYSESNVNNISNSEINMENKDINEEIIKTNSKKGFLEKLFG